MKKKLKNLVKSYQKPKETEPALKQRLESEQQTKQNDLQKAKQMLKEDVKSFKNTYHKNRKLWQITALDKIDQQLLSTDPKRHKKALHKLRRYYRLKDLLYFTKWFLISLLLIVTVVVAVQQSELYALQVTMTPKISSQLLFRAQAHLNFLNTFAGAYGAVVGYIILIKVPWLKYPYKHIKQVVNQHLEKLSETKDEHHD